MYVSSKPPAQIQPVDFLSIGLFGTRRRVNGVRALKPRGGFELRGTLLGDGGLTGGTAAFEGDIPRRLSHLDRTTAFTRSMAAAGSRFVTTPDEGTFIVRRILIEKTQDGRNFEDHANHEVWTHASAGVDAFGMGLTTCWPSVLDDGTEISAGFGFVGPGEGRNTQFSYLYGTAEGTQVINAVPAVMSSDTGYKRGFVPFTTSPRGRIAFVYTAKSNDPTVIQSQYTGLMVVFSQDCGMTWSDPIYPTGLFGDGPRETGFYAYIHTTIPIFVIPISQTKAIAGTASYYPGGTKESGFFIGNMKQRLVLIDSANQSFTGKSVLGEGRPDGDIHFFGSAVAIQGGVLFTIKTPWRVRVGNRILPEPFNLNVECWFTTNGDDVTYKGTMPWKAGETGPLIAIDKTTVACCVFIEGSGYMLYASQDLGVTWAPWALVSSGSNLLVNEMNSHLKNFESVIGLPGSPTPGAPWITDERIQAPT